MKIDIKKFAELNKNYMRGSRGYEKFKDADFCKIENFLITTYFSMDYIHKYQDMFCKVVAIEFDEKNKNNLDLLKIQSNNIPISGDLYDLYFNTSSYIRFFIVGSKKDVQNRVVKSFYDKEFSDFLYNSSFNSLEYNIIDLPKKNIKYNWKKKEIQNYAVINIFANGEYTHNQFNKICFLPNLNNYSLNFKNEILNIGYDIYELDGKHSEVKAYIKLLQPNEVLNFINLEIDLSFLELAFTKYQENKIFSNLSFSDFVKYQSIVLKDIKDNTTLTEQENILMDDFLELIKKIKENKSLHTPNFKLAFKLKYPEYSNFI